MKLSKIVELLNSTLDIQRFSDYSNNGLQVEASSEVKKIAFAVDGALEVFNQATNIGADLLVVHHGISWGENPKFFTGTVAKQLGFLFRNNLSLYACHLPLDAHKEIGNNAVLGDLIKLKKRLEFFEYCGQNIGIIGKIDKKLPVTDIAAIYEDKLDTKGKIYGDKKIIVSKIAICSGGGGLSALQSAAKVGAELLITGEFEHTMYHPAKELNITVISLGHYASETTGIKSLMELVLKSTKLDCQFINIPTGL